MAQVSFDVAGQIVAKSHAWASKLTDSLSNEEREGMRVGYANGMLAGAAEVDRLSEQLAEAGDKHERLEALYAETLANAGRLHEQRDALVKALNGVLNTVVDASVCPFGEALVRRQTDMCSCNYHAAARAARDAIAAAEGGKS